MTSGTDASGLKVWSDGKSYPDSKSLVFIILPILLDSTEKTAEDPVVDATDTLGKVL